MSIVGDPVRPVIVLGWNHGSKHDCFFCEWDATHHAFNVDDEGAQILIRCCDAPGCQSEARKLTIDIARIRREMWERLA